MDVITKSQEMSKQRQLDNSGEMGTQQKNSRKKSELMAMVRENQVDEQEAKEQRKKEQVLKQLEEDFKVRQEQMQREQEQKLKELVNSVSQSQGDIARKWEELQKKQEEFESKISLEKTDLMQERMRLREEQERADKEKAALKMLKEQEERALLGERAKVKENEDKIKNMEGMLLTNMDKFQKERDNYMHEYQQMMLNMKLQQDKQQTTLKEQEKEMLA